MNYYEELGVRQDASVEQIRQAYKLTTRLMHPDRHAEPALKQVAERQMQRLGEIVTILVDPAKRSHYDDLLLLRNGLQSGCGKRAISAPPEEWDNTNRVAGFALRYWPWVLTGIVVMGLGAWSFMQPNPAVLDRELRWAAAQRESAFGNGAPHALQKVNKPAPRTTPGSPKMPPVLSSQVPATEKTWIPVVAPREPPPSAHVLEDLPPRLDADPEALQPSAKSTVDNMPQVDLQSSFVGRWLYSPQPGDVAEDVIYPAIYVELLLVERDGELTGNYRARYKVPDRAVSPEVMFNVRGKAGSATTARLTWLAGDNAKGTAEMTLRSPYVLCVTWWTSESGRQAALASGTAVLIRQRVP